MFKTISKAMQSVLGRILPGPSSNRTATVMDWQDRYARLKATYDAARASNEYAKYWANADRFDADSANNKEVRHTLISRSRYEIGSNGYADGIAQTVATDLVGSTGPVLRMQTGSEGFNRMIELTWFLWGKSTKFRRKLWCMAHAKHTDGESFGVLRRNRKVRHPIPLDVCLYEAEQFQTPYMPFDEPGRIDGIKFDEFGNPQWYELLKEHPGTTRSMRLDFIPEQIPADAVLHWFKLRRPGQHRGVPEMSSTLNLGAAFRRWREATLSSAELAAILSIIMKTEMTPDEAQAVAPFTTMDVERGLMTFAPRGWEPTQLRGEFPTATHAEFHKTLVNEQARPKSMPYNKAACDSSSYNYASGRLDHQTYYGALDVEREDCNDLVLDPLFDTWFDLAVSRFGWLGGNPLAIGPAAKSHIWDWPKHRVADVESEANANETKLKSGQIFIHQLYSDGGMDFEDEVAKAATTFGLTVEEYKTRLLDVLMPKPQVQASGTPPNTNEIEDAVEAMTRMIERRREGLRVKANGHG